MRLGDVADESRLDPLSEVANRVIGMPLVHRLRDEVRILLRRREHRVIALRLAPGERGREPFLLRRLALHMLAAAKALDRHRRVPVVGRPDQHRVDVTVQRIQHLPVVRVELDARMLRAHSIATLQVDVAEPDELRARAFQSVDVRARTPTAANRNHLYGFVGTIGGRASREDHRESEGRRPLDEFTSVHDLIIA